MLKVITPVNDKWYYEFYINILFSQGNQEGQDPFERYPHPWSANHSDDYGYTRMTVYNGTHLNIQQVSVDNVSII